MNEPGLCFLQRIDGHASFRRHLAATAAAREPARQPVEIEIDHRRGVERQPLGDQKAANDGDAERPTQFRSRARAQRQRQAAAQKLPRLDFKGNYTFFAVNV